MSRRKRREEIEAEMAARVAAERSPVTGLAEMASLNAWRPADPPTVDEEDVQCICRLALGTHGVVDPDKKRRGWFSQMFQGTSTTGPMYNQYEAARLVNCYQGEVDGRSFVVGNAFYDIQFLVRPAGYSGPMAAPDELGVAFCAVALPTPWPWVQLILAMRGWLPSSKRGLGYPDLDAHYDVFSPNKDIARRIISPEIAALVAGRDDWGLSLHRATLACVTAAPISSGSDAQALVVATTRIAGLLPPSPASLS